MNDRKRYARPSVRSWGKVTEVTRSGYQRPKTDMKHGSKPQYGY